MTNPARLTDDDVRAGLEELTGWAWHDDEIVKEFELSTFPAAIAFVGRVADLAEAANHHPDLDIRYRRVRVALSTHSEGGITAKDLALASEIEGVEDPT